MIKSQKLLDLLKQLKQKASRKKKFEWGEQDIVVTKKPDQKDKDASD